MSKSSFEETPRFSEGLRLRRRVLGDAHVNRSLAHAEDDDFSRPVQQLTTEFGWGAVWARPGLEPKVRSFLSVALLASLGKHDELRTHLRGAINNGATREEIREVLLHAGVYCGLPVALESTRIAKEVLDALET